MTLCCLLLMRGARESALANTIMVLIKLGVLVLFIVIGFTAFSASNFEPFAPFGIAGIGAAASSIFFSFIGLDAVSTAGEEVHNPRRTLAARDSLRDHRRDHVLHPRVARRNRCAAVQDFEGQEAGLAAILRNITGSNVWSAILAAGAVISIFSVTLVTLYGQTRILFAMGRDGMLPEVFHRVDPTHPRPGSQHDHRRPLRRGARWVRAARRAHRPDEHGNPGRLHRGVDRRDDPASHPTRSTPGIQGPVLPGNARTLSGVRHLIMSGLPLTTYGLFVVWLGIAAIIYFTYSSRHSRLARGEAVATEEEPR